MRVVCAHGVVMGAPRGARGGDSKAVEFYC